MYYDGIDVTGWENTSWKDLDPDLGVEARVEEGVRVLNDTVAVQGNEDYMQHIFIK